jgi:hypothetical protein
VLEARRYPWVRNPIIVSRTSNFIFNLFFTIPALILSILNTSHIPGFVGQCNHTTTSSWLVLG